MSQPTKTLRPMETKVSLAQIPQGGDQRCAAQHFGAWAIEPRWFKSAIDAVRSGTFKPAKANKGKKASKSKAFSSGDDDDAEPAYAVQDGVALICIDGQMTKRGSSFGGCSTVETRKAIRAAADDWMVKAIMLHVCSPGGTVAGTADLADDILAARESKPVNCYIADMGCSAAYWAASQCEYIYANTTALIGSIGTYALLEDDSAAQEQFGVKYQIVSTGEYKGLGADGRVSDKLVADVQREVNELNVPFLAAVSRGRGQKIADLSAVADGRAHVSAQALSLGLIDEVASLDAAMTATIQESKKMNAEAFKAYAAEHPEAVASYIEQGKKSGVADGIKQERDRFDRVLAAAGGSTALAIAGFKAGHDGDTVKLAADVAAEAKASADAIAKAGSEASAAKDAEIAKLKEQVAFVQGNQGGVATGAATQAAAKPKAEAPENPGDDAPIEQRREWAKAMAAYEWDADASTHKVFSTKERYVAYRQQELLGNLRALTK